MKRFGLALAMLCLAGWSTTATAADVEAIATRVDHTWVLLAVALVALMQVGFLFLECGMVRSKTTINVAQKNLTDLMVSIGGFWLIGFTIMFGASLGGWTGFSLDFVAMDRPGTDTVLFFVFQAMFCGTAATIVSGAIAERASFWAYTLIAAAIGVVIYPVVGHWAWGSALLGDNETLLGQFGFMDFAGSTVVHSTGAWIALAAVIVIGPRLGRFSSDGAVHEIPGHNPVLSGAGAVLLLVGWFGFNGGSALGMSDVVPVIVANTAIAAVFGGIAGLVYGMSADQGKLKVDRAINGLLGGLVAVTAGPDVFGLQGAAIAGLIGGLVTQYFNYVMLHHWRMDDVVGAIGVHGAAGAVGTVLVAVLAPSDALLAGSRWEQMLVQTGGVIACFIWSFGAAYLVLKLIGKIIPLRVSEEDEIAGLNTAEHGQTLGTGHLQQMLARMLENDTDGGELVNIEQGDESGELSELFNLLVHRMDAGQITDQRNAIVDLEKMEQRRRMDEDTVAQINNLIEAAARGQFGNRLTPRAGSSDVLHSACGGINQLFDVVEQSTGKLSVALERLAHGDLTHQLTGMGEGRFEEISRNYNQSVDQFRETQEQSADTMKRMTRESRSTADQADTALREIEASSAEALKIVSIIEEIASKTSLLAINASIEAAHAGEKGAAFGVVADQVKALAGRVSDASTDIDRIITSNAATVGDGVTAITRVRDKLSEIDSEISLLADRVDTEAEMAA